MKKHWSDELVKMKACKEAVQYEQNDSSKYSGAGEDA